MVTTTTAAGVSTDHTGLAFGLVIAAGLSTCIGAAAVYFNGLVKLASKPVLAAGLGFSGGVMLYVSFVEIFQKSKGAFEGVEGLSPEHAYLSATLCMFGGMALMRFISWVVHKIDGNHDHCVCDAAKHEDQSGVTISRGTSDGSPDPRGLPLVDLDNLGPASKENDAARPALDKQGQPQGQCAEACSHDHAEPAGVVLDVNGEEKTKKGDDELMRMGLNTAVAIGIHNFPEGLATFVATLADPTVGATLAIAIAIHNIPEGLCVALPIYYATGSRHKGFMWAFWSGISEPIGALIGWGIIKASGDDMNQQVYGILFGVVAGMMVMIVLMELIPTGYRYDPDDKYVTNSLVVGMFVMACSLCLFML